MLEGAKWMPTTPRCGASGRRDSLKKGFVYQSTENRGELKVSYFQGAGEAGAKSGQIVELALGAA